jgi:hypothetical protein
VPNRLGSEGPIVLNGVETHTCSWEPKLSSWGPLFPEVRPSAHLNFLHGGTPLAIVRVV